VEEEMEKEMINDNNEINSLGCTLGVGTKTGSETDK